MSVATTGTSTASSVVITATINALVESGHFKIDHPEVKAIGSEIIDLVRKQDLEINNGSVVIMMLNLAASLLDSLDDDKKLAGRAIVE